MGMPCLYPDLVFLKVLKFGKSTVANVSDYWTNDIESGLFNFNNYLFPG